jgi:hypothetical protein
MWLQSQRRAGWRELEARWESFWTNLTLGRRMESSPGAAATEGSPVNEHSGPRGPSGLQVQALSWAVTGDSRSFVEWEGAPLSDPGSAISSFSNFIWFITSSPRCSVEFLPITAETRNHT